MLLAFGAAEPVVAGAVRARVLRAGTDITDPSGVLAERYDAKPGTVYLIRPDQHVAARWRSFDRAKAEAALRRCLAH